MRRKVISIVIPLITLLLIFVCIICMGFCLPAQYGNTYYAVLPQMFKKLKNTKGKKIIVVGNSAVAFGLDPKLAECELDGFSVCSFGLYGAIGTKAMMDLSRVNICDGDIVVLAPEQMPQSMSLYFNGEHVWNAVDGDFGMLEYIRNGGEMVGDFFGYVGRKFGYYSNGSAPNPTDVYAASSFDEDLKMVYDRPYNTLPLGYEPNTRISYRGDALSVEFAEYVNEYNEFVAKKGARLLFGFSPVNAAGLEVGTSSDDIDKFYDRADKLLNCEILGDPHEYIFESEWFYDSNVHLNSSGSVVYTERLVRDLKVYLGDSSPIGIELPQKPSRPDDGAHGDDGKDSALFMYESEGTGLKIVGLTDDGKQASAIEIPDFYQGKKILSFAPDVFAGNTAIEQITIGKYIYGIADSSFKGCSNLKRLYMPKDVRPSQCKAYFALLDGVTNCTVYVPHDMVQDYANDYFWSRYAAHIAGY